MGVEHLVTVYGTAVMVCAPDGIPLDTEGVATELVGEAIGLRADLVVVPAERLTDDFFDIASGIAQKIAEKFATYRLRLAIVGDITHHLSSSPSLDAWVDESNGGTQLWFCPTFDDVKERLDRRAKPQPM